MRTKLTVYLGAKRFWHSWILVLCLFTTSCSEADKDIEKTSVTASSSDQLTIAVASNFFTTIKKLTQDHPKFKDFTFVSGSSGTLYAQADNGAPYDLFLSANEQFPTRLHQDGLASAPVTYAKGKLAIFPIIGKDIPLSNIIEQANIIAIANPHTAPFGVAASEVLSTLNLKDNRIIHANNVSQAYQFADSGNADLAFVSESLLIYSAKENNQEKHISYLLLPPNSYSPIIQQASILNKSKNRQLAEDFLHFLQSKNTQQALTKLGYSSIY